MSTALLRRIEKLEATEHTVDLSELEFITVLRGTDGILRNYNTGEPVEDTPLSPKAIGGTFRFITTLGDTDE